MEIISVVFLTMGCLILIEGLIIALFPKSLKKIGQGMLKNTKKIRRIGITEVIIALVFIALGLLSFIYW